MADVWGEVQRQPMYMPGEAKTADWFLRSLVFGVVFLLIKFAVEWIVTGVFISWHALGLLVLFLALPYVIWLLKGNEGWESLVQLLFVTFCVYVFFGFVTFIGVLVA